MEGLIMSDLTGQDKLLDEHIKAGNTEAAVKLLYDLIVENAKAKKFAKAEALRDKLLEVDEMALTEIIQSAEIIEEEKTSGMDQNHMDIWSDLYSALTKEEANALYYSLEEEKYDADATIFEEGKPNNRLHFINQGQLKMVYRQGDKEMLLKDFGTGDLAGEDTFFNFTNCSTSLITLSRVQLSFLDEEALEKLEKDFSGLKSKLQDYCLKLVQVPDLLKMKDLDRRIHDRIKLKGIVVFQLLNKSGGPIGKAFKGTLSDISAGGLSFFITTPKKDTVRLLLGRKLNLKFALSLGESSGNASLNGTGVGVCDHFFNEWSIHIKFDKALSEKTLNAIKPAEAAEEKTTQ